MKFDKNIEAFIKDYLGELEANNAAIFAGAGLSAGSDCVDWGTLLKDFAEQINLDVKKESSDLISVAQYFLNKNANNRHALSKKIIKEFHHGKTPNENHEILARLPIQTFWTTNYDKLIEKSLENVGKVIDVKYTKAQLAITIDDRDVTIYKMHGDVEHPDDAILSKDQYEKYFNTHGAFINALIGDLISKTFLFIGFSFTDPNLQYIFSRIRVNYEKHLRTHYCIQKEVEQAEGESQEDFEYRKIKQILMIEDLLRFNIHVLLVKSYSDITSILKEIENRFKRKTIFISGSAHEYGNWKTETAEKFITNLSKELIKNDFKVVSGFGLGVGSFVINGVLEEVYLNKKDKLRNQLLLRPFPQGEDAKSQWKTYREDMISYAGTSLFIFGNKLENGKLESADGVKKEFDISVEQKAAVVPIGATGYKAQELWDLVLKDYDTYFESKDYLDLFQSLGDEAKTPEELIKITLNLLKKLMNK